MNAFEARLEAELVKVVTERAVARAEACSRRPGLVERAACLTCVHERTSVSMTI